MSETRHQAEQMQKHLDELAECERRQRALIDGGGDYSPVSKRIAELNAHIRVRAETLARAVLAETTP